MSALQSVTADDGSEYGSDFSVDGEELLISLADAADAADVVGDERDDNEDVDRRIAARVPPSLPGSLPGSQEAQRSIYGQSLTSSEIDLAERLAAITRLGHSARPLDSPGTAKAVEDESQARIKFEETKPEDGAAQNMPYPIRSSDPRSPLQRFRTPPKKPLSVTDLVSPAWCELQYWYTLTLHGKKKQTPAMKRGETVHKALEEQVHETVVVDIETREDHWGLKLWNVIQGLRTLRFTGMTRELELWGTVDGNVVNGIIDELSYKCTDPDLEAELKRDSRRGDAASTQHVLEIQQTIGQFFKGLGNTTLEAQGRNQESARARTEQTSSTADELTKIYITDVKTRMSRRLPQGASNRPTHMQMMLYRKMLVDLANNEVDPKLLFERYNLKADDRLSDRFISQIGSLEMNFSSGSTQDSQMHIEEPIDTVTELLQNNSLRSLWRLMIREYQKTMPQGGECISPILRVEFRAATDGHIIGARTFPYREDDIQQYLTSTMSWWKGEREAQGVNVEEAFKCKICDFAEGCMWRLNKIDDAIEQSRARRSNIVPEMNAATDSG